MMQEDERQEMTRFFASYSQAFEEFNAEKLVVACTLLCLFSGPTGVMSFAQAEALRETILTLFGLYRRLQFGQAHPHIVALEELGVVNVLVRIAWDLVSVTGTSLYSCCTSYVLHGKAGEWKIAAVFIDDEPEKLQNALKEQG